jgi:DNA modification methylase
MSLLGDLQPVTSIRSNRLFYGDNLTIMQNMPSGCVDLIYLDPPFNSQRSYNLIYKQMTGLPVPEQEEAFCDAWEMDPEKEEMARRMPIVLRQYDADESLVAFWNAWINALRSTQPRMLAYLVYMTYRLYEMRRILKPTGSIYLHCDPTASHYIKVIMDGVFGHQNFRNEIIWKGTTAHSDTTSGFSHETDTILCYVKSRSAKWHPQYRQHSEKYLKSHYRHKDKSGRIYRLDNIIRSQSMGSRPNPTYDYNRFTPPSGWRVVRDKLEEIDRAGRLYWSKTGVPYLVRYLDEQKGEIVGNVWDDIAPVNSMSKERLGYPTQKPVPLLERIVRASSEPGGVVFDPFCGCGTTIYAAHQAGRRWIGCDIAILSVRMVRDVLRKRYGLVEGRDYKVAGVPTSVDGARELFSHDPHQFQHWAVELAGGFCTQARSGDKGVDGRIYFETENGLRNMVLSVKGGKLTPAYVRELIGTVSTPGGGSLGGFICLDEPTDGMTKAAKAHGTWSYDGRDYPRIQIRTISDLLQKRGFDMPTRVETLDWERQGRLPF